MPQTLTTTVGGPLAIFDEDYLTAVGVRIRHYMHVCNGAEAHVAALARRAASGAYNTGTGIDHSSA